MNIIKQFLVLSTLFFASPCIADYTQRTISYSYSTTELSMGNEACVSTNQPSLSDHACDRWATAALFSDYWHYQDTAAMIDSINSTAHLLLQHIFGVFETATKDRNLSSEEQATLCANLLAEMLGCETLEQMGIGFTQESPTPDDADDNADDNDEDTEEILEEPTQRSPVTTFSNTAVGREILGLLDLYHVILVRLASRTADNNRSDQEVFQALEAELVAIVSEKQPQQNDDISPELAKSYALESLTAINEFLHKKLRELCAPVLQVAGDIVERFPERDVNALTVLDFKLWADLKNEAVLDQYEVLLDQYSTGE